MPEWSPFMERLKTVSRQLRWKLTLSYIAVTVSALLVMSVVLSTLNETTSASPNGGTSMVMERINARTVDNVIFIIANAANILLVGIFLARSNGRTRVEYVLGLILIALALPLSGAVILNLIGKREWWTTVLPVLLIAFLLTELALDYILKLDFRNTQLLGPYLGVYYLGLMGMIGYSFLMGRGYGFVTLSTYFLNLLATWYAWSNASHRATNDG